MNRASGTDAHRLAAGRKPLGYIWRPLSPAVVALFQRHVQTDLASANHAVNAAYTGIQKPAVIVEKFTVTCRLSGKIPERPPPYSPGQSGGLPVSRTDKGRRAFVTQLVNCSSVQPADGTQMLPVPPGQQERSGAAR